MNTAIIICGSPGAGKSTYGRRLARQLNAAFIDIDTATERLVKLALSLSGNNPDDRDSPFFKKHFRQPIYDQLFDLAKENLDHMDVVIAGPFTREIRDSKWPSALEKTLKSQVVILWFEKNECRFVQIPGMWVNSKTGKKPMTTTAARLRLFSNMY